MPVQSSGEVKVTDVVTEFGGSEPHACRNTIEMAEK